jgi:hypothetical protein
MQCFQGVPEKMTSEALYGPAGRSFTDGEGVSILLKSLSRKTRMYNGGLNTRFKPPFPAELVS